MHVTKTNVSKLGISSINALSATNSQSCKTAFTDLINKKPTQYLIVLAQQNLSHFVKHITKIGSAFTTPLATTTKSSILEL